MDSYIFIRKLSTGFQNETMDHVLLPLIKGGLFGNGSTHTRQHICSHQLSKLPNKHNGVYITELVQRTIDKAAAD